MDVLVALSTALLASIPGSVMVPIEKQNESTVVRVQNLATASQLTSLDSNMGSVRVLQTSKMPNVPASVKVNSFQEALLSWSGEYPKINISMLNIFKL